MGENSKIEWTHHTFNPWRGCTKVSAGCANCYADAQAKRNPAVLGVWGPRGTRVVASEAMWRQPAKWNADAKAAGERRRVFCASMADVFEDRDDVREARRRLFRLIESTPGLDWLLLTKRPQDITRLSREAGCDRLPENVWIGTSVEDQRAADERMPHLARVDARVRFLSIEPLLGPVELSRWIPRGRGWSSPGERLAVDWIIVGGESGPKARPMGPRWVRALRDCCLGAGVPFFFKQWGEWAPEDRPDELALADQVDAGPADMHIRFVGKKAAGRLLDGRTWDEVPRG